MFYNVRYVNDSCTQVASVNVYRHDHDPVSNDPRELMQPASRFGQ